MEILAAATSSAPATPANPSAPHTATERLGEIPMEFWVKLGIGVFGLIAIVLILRKVAHINKVVLAVGTLIVVSSMGFYWIYERTEPGWATPVVEWLAGFFPTKGRRF